MALVAALVLALATAVAAAGAAAPDSGRIAFLNNTGLHMVGPDGTGLRLLQESTCPPDRPPPCPVAKVLAWSPDAERLAFVVGGQLHVLDTRDGSHRLLPTSVDVSGTTPPAWSPDGSQLAFLSVEVFDGGGAASDLHIIDVADGGVRALTDNGHVADGIAWAPATQIAYSSFVGGPSELFVVDPDGANRRQLTDTGLGGTNRWPAWSPRGTEIAFIHLVGSEYARLYAVRPDGSGLRSLSDAPVDVGHGHPPAWSPDGSRIAFSTPVNGRPVPFTGHVPGRDLYVIAANGSSQIRLTQSAEREAADRRPTWSPDGSQLVFEATERHRGDAESGIYTVNADGTCEGRIAGVDGWRPQWQHLPGAAMASRRCSDLAVVSRERKGRGQAGHFQVTVLNDGTEPLTRVRLRGTPPAATVRAAASRHARCAVRSGAVRCDIGRLGVGASVTVEVRVEARVISRLRGEVIGPDVTFHVLAAEAEADLSNNAVPNEIGAKSCTAETSGAGEVLGTDLDDIACGRSGRDRISGRSGDDRIEAGRGDDVLRGGLGDDVIVAGPGKDKVSCGAGLDRATVDAADRVAPNCERVRRIAA
jgi:TolB protein